MIFGTKAGSRDETVLTPLLSCLTNADLNRKRKITSSQHCAPIEKLFATYATAYQTDHYDQGQYDANSSQPSWGGAVGVSPVSPVRPQ